MNLNKQYEFFNPMEVTDEVHIIGCGAIGSSVAEMLTRLGFPKLHLYDFDKVSDHNITNQMFRMIDVGCPKVNALAAQLKEINPDIQLELHDKGWNEYSRVTGIVFIAVDSIEVRKEIVQTYKYNRDITFVSDCRMRLTDAQYYAAAWNNEKEINRLYNSMDFTSEEAKASTPVSACGTTLSVTPTVRTIVSLAVSNLINFLNKQPHKTLINIDAFAMNIVCFPE
jgi:molybdopterin/thiamine biosynthesis adenylyltransferase